MTQIRADLYLCRIDDAVIGLDLRNNRYTLYRGETAQILADHLERRIGEADIARLGAAGLLQDGPCDRRYDADRVAAPDRGLEAYDDRAAGPAQVGRAVLAHMAARRFVSRRPLSTILDSLGTAMPSRIPAAEPECLKIALAHRRARRFVSQLDQCLPRSVAVIRSLMRDGLHATLVIGVMLPFAAHCWVQSGATILTDDLDEVRPYTPILAL